MGACQDRSTLSELPLSADSRQICGTRINAHLNKTAIIVMSFCSLLLLWESQNTGKHEPVNDVNFICAGDNVSSDEIFGGDWRWSGPEEVEGTGDSG